MFEFIKYYQFVVQCTMYVWRVVHGLVVVFDFNSKTVVSRNNIINCSNLIWLWSLTFSEFDIDFIILIEQATVEIDGLMRFLKKLESRTEQDCVSMRLIINLVYESFINCFCYAWFQVIVLYTGCTYVLYLMCTLLHRILLSW